MTRFRRTNAQVAALRSALHDIVEADRPMTVRQVFYQMVVRGLIEKTEKEYDQTVGRLLREMRLKGEMPYEWIVDESRRRRVTQTYASPAEALDDCAYYYRRSALKECKDYVEVWCEKDALAALLYEITSDYDVPLLVSRGMPSLSILHGTALEIMAADRDGKQTYVYQFGDHDPTGVIIPKAIEKRLEEMALGCDITVERVALTEELITLHSLPTRPTKREGNTHAKGFVGDSVELDALPPRDLRDLVRAVIERHITPRALAKVRKAQAKEQAEIRALIAR
jgi:hypothetical protein